MGAGGSRNCEWVGTPQSRQSEVLNRRERSDDGCSIKTPAKEGVSGLSHCWGARDDIGILYSRNSGIRSSAICAVCDVVSVI